HGSLQSLSVTTSACPEESLLRTTSVLCFAPGLRRQLKAVPPTVMGRKPRRLLGCIGPSLGRGAVRLKAAWKTAQQLFADMENGDYIEPTDDEFARAVRDRALNHMA